MFARLLTLSILFTSLFMQTILDNNIKEFYENII